MLNVKPFNQKTGLCGPAVLKMVLEYYGIRKSEAELARLTHCDPAVGIGGEVLVKTTRALGLKATLKDNATFQAIAKYLTKKIPVIVDWFSTDDGHYSVVVALDKKFIYLQDPELGRINKIDRRTFYRIWFDFDKDYIQSPRDLILRRMIVITK